MSATIMMNPAQQRLPHRKPVPGRVPQNDFQQQQHPPPPQQQAQYAPEPQRTYSNAYRPNGSPHPADRASSIYSVATTQQPLYSQPTRRVSNATSTSSTSTNAGLQRAPTNASMPRRSTSSRSTSSASPTSYVALMRKQKATVWCDRAQHEDPRILAAQRAAKMRAAMEVAGGSHRVSTSSNNAPSVGIRSKIRHHGAPKASTYMSGGNMSGAGVPMRLSATEVDENDSDEEMDSKYMNYHRRNGSGRSSLGSEHKEINYLHSGRGNSNGSTPPTGDSPTDSLGDLMEEGETPVPNQYAQRSTDYFAQSGGNGGSGSSAEAEQQFGGVGGLPQSQNKPDLKRRVSEELRRRGSVDDRTMTMGGGRLFVANPDLSD